MSENNHIPFADDRLAKRPRLTLAPKNPQKEFVDHVIETTHVHIPQSRGHHINEPRYINLLTQQIFGNLVNLYANVFCLHWHHYKHSIERYSPPPGIPLRVYAARCYISMWFIDLYVSNRDVLRTLSPVAYLERYQGELLHVYDKYDNYLALLNASIRPTYLEYSHDDALFVPVIVESFTSFDVGDLNPFGIVNFTPLKLCYKFAGMMRVRGLGRSIALSKDATGRPWWLFDWHSDKSVCSWFSAEGNYDVEDVTLAYILGTACSPNLGLRDADEWQYFADGVVPEYINRQSYDRVVERRFYGSYEYRTMEIDRDFSIARALAAAEGKSDHSGEEGKEDYALTPRFKLIDWVYHHCVIFRVDDQGRDRVHRLFIDDDIPESLW